MREGIETVFAMVAAYAALPHTAKRHLRRRDMHHRIIDAHAAGGNLCQKLLLYGG